jgi:hypothetical protein
METMSIPGCLRGACPAGVRWPGGACPFSALGGGHMGTMSIPGCLRGACPQEGPALIPSGRGVDGQLGEAEKFRYSSICF